MQIISWNLNGLLSCVKNDSFREITAINPEIVCCQEIRTKQQLEVLPGYHHFWNPSQRDGYAGTLIMSKSEPMCIKYGLGVDALDDEGRVITAEFEKCFVVNAYAPNSQKDLRRHFYRTQWDDAFREHMCILADSKPVIACGDFNVARFDIDIYPENLRQYWSQQGYASDERSNLETLFECGFVDAFRYLYPLAEGSYTWWSNRLNKRNENRGWRLDYFILSECFAPDISKMEHLTHIMGSDHCPIHLEINL